MSRKEPAIQFEEIYEKWYSPEERRKRIIEKNREQRRQEKAEDTGA